MSKPNAITVSRSKRGTTIKASGAAAQALFDAMVKGVEEAKKSTPHTTPPSEPTEKTNPP